MVTRPSLCTHVQPEESFSSTVTSGLDSGAFAGGGAPCSPASAKAFWACWRTSAACAGDKAWVFFCWWQPARARAAARNASRLTCPPAAAASRARAATGRRGRGWSRSRGTAGACKRRGAKEREGRERTCSWDEDLRGLAERLRQRGVGRAFVAFD